jgi:hypothetical protein
MTTPVFRLLCLFLFIGNSAVAQSIDQQWVTDHYRKQELSIRMRDGVALHTTIYAPTDTSHRHPMLLTRTPYSCQPYGEEFAPALWKSYLSNYLQRGYILVFQDVRGRWLSEGVFCNVRPYIEHKHTTQQIDEASDAYDTVEYLVQHVAGNNGKVGVYGSSYPGFYALMAAASRHPAIKAVSPQAPVTDWFLGDDIHHNGAFCLRDTYSFIGGSFGRKMDNPTTHAPSCKSTVKGDEYDYFLSVGTIDSLQRLLNGASPFWDEIAAHPDYDAWWQMRCAQRAMHNIDAAVLVVGGLFDAEDCYGTWQTYATLHQYNPQCECRLVVGPWVHGGWRATHGGEQLGAINFGEEARSEQYQQQVELPFFEYYLNDATDVDLGEAVRIFFTGENRWRKFDSWPADAAKPYTLYLHATGVLSDKRPKRGEHYSDYLSDPQHPVPYDYPLRHSRDKAYMVADQRFASERNDVLTFATAPLTTSLTVAGGIRASLQVSLSSTDADFVVKLIDVWPDGSEHPGYEMLLRGEVMRGRYRNSFVTPCPFTPDEIEQVTFDLPDVAHTFRVGHRLMIQIQSSWFPLIDRNPQQFVDGYRCTAADFVPCRVKVYHEPKHPSTLTLLRID